MCSKQLNEGKNMKPGMMDLGNNLNSMVKMQDEPFIDSKSEITPPPECSTEEEDLLFFILSSEIKTKNVSGDPLDVNENLPLKQTSTSGPGRTIEQSGSQIQPGVQPLPSNIINKQQGTMEAQYRQQQSQEFVFSTALANKAAECVVQRQYRDNMNPNNFPGVSQLTLTGTQVPTENLTPQQRQHREEQLARINRMKQVLFPENQTQSTDEFGNPHIMQKNNFPGEGINAQMQWQKLCHQHSLNPDVISQSIPSLTLQQKQHKNSTPSKKPNLMPVPSPQQIQYLNAFEGQELTLQKQPNTGLKESNMQNAPLAETPKCKAAGSSPFPQATEKFPRFPNLVTLTSTTCTTPVSTQSDTSVPASKDTTTVPSSPDTSGPSPWKLDNLPLNTSNINCPLNSKSILFDPITSLAQMSQQLTNQSTPRCPGTGSMMPFNASSMHMVGNLNHTEPHVGGPVGPGGQMGHDNQNMENVPFVQNNPIISCAGPMMDMNPRFLNTSSPKPNMGNQAQCRVGPFFGNPNFPKMMGLGPPSLDFLPRFPHPMDNMNSKVPFIPNCHSNSMDGVNPNNGIMNRGRLVINSGGSVMSILNPNMLSGGSMVLNPRPGGPLRGQIRLGSGGMMKVPPMRGGPVPVQLPGPAATLRNQYEESSAQFTLNQSYFMPK